MDLPSWLATRFQEYFIPKSDINKEQFASNWNLSALRVNLR
jgi:hypothetical protein